jgi:hypothetical protein
MIFLGEHDLDFLTQPKEGIIASIGSRLSNYKPVNADFYRRFEEKIGKNAPYPMQGDTGKWFYADVSLNGEYGIQRTVFIIGGTFGFLIRISAAFIEFLYPGYKINEWYSKENREEVTEWRIFFRQMVDLLGGSKALYISNAYFIKYHDFLDDPAKSFKQKLDEIIARHGTVKKDFQDFTNGKHPRYFIDKCGNDFQPEIRGKS